MRIHITFMTRNENKNLFSWLQEMIEFIQFSFLIFLMKKLWSQKGIIRFSYNFCKRFELLV